MVRYAKATGKTTTVRTGIPGVELGAVAPVRGEPDRAEA